MKQAEKLGHICFSTPFDETVIEFLEILNVQAYKIASFEIGVLPMIRKGAATGEPLSISTGMTIITEIDESVCTALYARDQERMGVYTTTNVRAIILFLMFSSLNSYPVCLTIIKEFTE